MTCRGSRFADGATRNPDGQVFMKNRETDEWLKQNQRATRNFIRKWGHFVKHDQYLKPIIPPKYNIGFIVHNCNKQLLHLLEPWCSNIFLTMLNPSEGQAYMMEEQDNTKFDLIKRIRPISEKKYNDILVEFDCKNFNEEDFLYIQQLPEILQVSTILEDDYGCEFEVGNLKVVINSMKTYEDKLININNEKPYMEIA